MYTPDPDPAVLLQGDVLRDFVVVAPISEFFVVRGVDDDDPQLFRAQPIEACPDAFVDGREAVLAEATLTDVVIVSQSCDVQRKPFVTVGAVHSVAGVPTWSAIRVEEARAEDKHLRYFVLDPAGSFPLSVVDFSLLYTVRRETLVAHAAKRALSMTAMTRAAFQQKLGWYFARPAE